MKSRLSAGVAFPLILALLLFVPGPPSARAAAPRPVPGAFTLAVLPDTQFYAQKYPANYLGQTRWLAENAKRYNLAYVLHVGDITQNNTNAEWRVAVEAHDLLKGVVPVALVPGNHDLGPGGKAGTRETLLSEFFTAKEFRTWPTFGGIYDREPERMENSYHLFSAGGRDWLILALEFGPRDDVLRWANAVVAGHADRAVILITHAYLRPDNQRFNRWLKVGPAKKSAGLDSYKLSQQPGGFNDGEDVWKKLVARHANFLFVFSGHVCYTSLLSTPGEHGNTVHQILVDYQKDPNGGNGYLRLLQFHPDGVTVTVDDYSPVLDQMSAVPNTSYELKIPAPAGKGK